MEVLDASLQAARAARAKLDAALDAQLAGLERRVAAVKEMWREAHKASELPTGPLPVTLELNVGGDTNFAVSREAITRTPSRLAQMFSGRWDHMLPRDSEGRFFLDMDNRQLRAIFDWLTELTRVMPSVSSPPHPSELLPEKHKWGLDELMHYLRLAKSHLQGPVSSEVIEGSIQQLPASQEQDDEHGVSAAAKELSDQVALCVLQAERGEEEVRAMRAALEEERTYVEGSVSAFRTEGAIVPLNVSGVTMATARATLLQEQGSMLAAKFGPTWRLQDQELVDGGVFLDADPAAFAHLLQYLRLRRLGVPALGLLPPQAAQGTDLRRLLDYYGISMKRRQFAESAITTPEQQLQLAAWLPEGARAELLFRASRDGFEAAAFHARCDDQGATLVVALSAGGHRFGGFTDAPWTSTGGYSTCTSPFLFRLHGPQGEPPAQCSLKAGRMHHGIYCSTDGPTFGGGHDLWIKSGTGMCQCVFNTMGWSYELPPDGATTLAEAKCVTLTDYEVFRIA